MLLTRRYGWRWRLRRFRCRAWRFGPFDRAIASNWVKTPRHYLIRAQLQKNAENSANHGARSQILKVFGDWRPVFWLKTVDRWLGAPFFLPFVGYFGVQIWLRLP